MAGNVFITVEVVLGAAEGINFEREYYDETGYQESLIHVHSRQIRGRTSWFPQKKKLLILVHMGRSSLWKECIKDDYCMDASVVARSTV